MSAFGRLGGGDSRARTGDPPPSHRTGLQRSRERKFPMQRRGYRTRLFARRRRMQRSSGVGKSPHYVGKMRKRPGSNPEDCPTGLRLNRMDLPCSRCFLWLHAGGTEPREHLKPLALSRPAIPPSPLSDRVGYSDHVRFRGYVPVHCRSGLQPPCLRFATAVTGRHARLGSRLLARLCRGRHCRRQTSTRLQGATLIKPDEPISGIRLSDWLHREVHGEQTNRARLRHGE